MSETFRNYVRIVCLGVDHSKYLFFSLWAFSTCKHEIHYWKYVHLEIYGLFCFYLVPSSCKLEETTKHGSYGPIMEESTKIQMF